MHFKLKSISLIAALFMVFGTIGCSTNEISSQGKTYKIGDRGPAGGWIFYDKGNNSGGWRYLEAAPEDQSTEARWGCYGISITGAEDAAIGTGKANTAAIIKSCGEADIAAKIAADYRGGGKSDWFLPSKDELYMMYTNLHTNGVGGFAGDLYWSSSEYSEDYAWLQYFNNGGHPYDGKNYGRRVRAVRAF